MKKTLIISALAAGLVSVAFAADGTSTVQQVPSGLPQTMTTGSSTLDAQIKALRQSYETQIRALQQQYLTQLRALVGTSTPNGNRGLHLGEVRRGMMGTTTASGSPMMRGQRGGEQGDSQQGNQGQGQGQGRGDRGQMMGAPQVEGASTDNTQGQSQGQGGGFMQFFRGFFGR